MIIPIEMKMVQSINQKRVGNLSWEAPLECEEEILSQVHCLSSDVVKSLRQVFESEYVRQFIEIYEKARESIEMEERFWKMQPRIKEKISIIGQYGWTALPGALFESYLDCPTNTQQETDDFFMSQLDDNTVQNLLSEIEVITDEPDDVSEAIFDYKNERYKSSAMILFSLIDAILIKSNENEFRERKDVPRKWGNTFYLDKEKGVRFHDLHFAGIITSLIEFFRSYNKFIYSEHIINRNVLSHGMLKRKVTKKDCLQVFLLLLATD